jgi:Phosphatidate cytidylyltransferase, mitochondrial
MFTDVYKAFLSFDIFATFIVAAVKFFKARLLRALLFFTGSGCQDISATAKLYHLTQLPRMPQVLLTRNWNARTRRKMDAEDALLALAHSLDTASALRNVLRHIVWNSSVGQSLKGLLTAGPLKSFKYAASKLAKTFQKN